jgi:EpsI family protein
LTNRREWLIGAGCLIGAAAAYEMVPRRHVSLLRAGEKVEQIVPRTFGPWSSQDVSDLVAPKSEGSLAAKLYEETVGRVYTRSDSSAEIMMLLAHGDTQSDDLQLHRPEICYPAFGFAISNSASAEVRVLGDVSIPSRRLVADSADRRETILYWSRLGEYLPLDRKEQQFDRLRTSIKGVIADGLLARFSVLGADPDAALRLMYEFVPALVRAVAPGRRDVLIGSVRATALARAGF